MRVVSACNDLHVSQSIAMLNAMTVTLKQSYIDKAFSCWGNSTETRFCVGVLGSRNLLGESEEGGLLSPSSVQASVCISFRMWSCMLLCDICLGRAGVLCTIQIASDCYWCNAQSISRCKRRRNQRTFVSPRPVPLNNALSSCRANRVSISVCTG